MENSPNTSNWISANVSIPSISKITCATMMSSVQTCAICYPSICKQRKTLANVRKSVVTSTCENETVSNQSLYRFKSRKKALAIKIVLV